MDLRPRNYNIKEMIISPDKNGVIDHVVFNILQGVKSGIPIIPVTRTANFVFNENLKTVDRYVLADFVEYDWNWNREETHLFGVNTEMVVDKFPGDEWKKFDEWVTGNPPTIYFKRELLAKDKFENVYPIDWPCFQQSYPIQSRQEFNARPIDVFNAWGYSHEERRRFHGEVFLNAIKNNRAVIDNLSHLEREMQDHRKKWVSVFVPWHSRFPMQDILNIQGQSKISVAMPGAGAKCFKMSESPINAVMMMQDDGMKYSYDWVHGENCIMAEPGEEIETIELALRMSTLYDIYVEGHHNLQNYLLPNYIKNYIEKIIHDTTAH